MTQQALHLTARSRVYHLEQPFELGRARALTRCGHRVYVSTERISPTAAENAGLRLCKVCERAQGS